MGIPIWCFLAPLFLDTVGGSLHDIVAESYYETPQSSSPAPQPTQPTPPELIGMKEIVLYLTPDQVETLQAAGAIVQPYPEYENGFDELQEPFRVNTAPRNDQQYQNWINPLEYQKDNSELQNYYKFLNIQEINDDLTMMKTQATESTTEQATTTSRYRLSKTRQQYKEKELSTTYVPKKPSRTKISNQNNNDEYVRFLPDYEHEILQIIPYRPLPLAPYQYEDIIYTQENLEAQQNAYSQANTTSQQNTFIQVDTERQLNAYSQETIDGTRNVYSQANVVAPQNAVAQVNTEAQRNAYPLTNTVTQQNANVQPNEYSQKTTEVQQNAYSQANVVVQQNIFSQVNKEAQRNLHNLANNGTQQNALSQASTVPQQNGFNRVTTEAQLNAYYPETTEEQRNEYFQVNAAVHQNALTQLNTEAQRNIPTSANIVIQHNGFTPANTVPQQNTFELDNAKTQLNAYFQGTTERQRNEYFQVNSAAQQKASIQVNVKAQQNIFPKTIEVKQNAYSQENTASKNNGYSYKTKEGQQNTFTEINTEAQQNVYTPANTPKTAYTIAYTEAPQYKLFQDITVPQRNAFSQANTEAHQNAYSQANAVTQRTVMTDETTEAPQNIIYSQANTAAPRTTSTVRNTKAQQNGHSRVNKGNQRNVFRRPRPSRIRQKGTTQPKEPEKNPVPVLIEKPTKQKPYLKSQDTEEFKETLTSIEGLPPLPPLELPLEKPVTPAPPAPTVKTRILQQDHFSLLLAPLYQHQTITESISRQKEELLRNEFNIRTKLKQMKESPGYYDQREYFAELEKLTRNFGQQNALARIETKTDSENSTVFVNQGSGNTENLVKSTELPMLVRMPKPHEAKLLAPSSVPIEFTLRQVPKPVVMKKKNVYVRVQNPYTFQKFTPFTERQNIPHMIPINPEQITIMRHIWEH